MKACRREKKETGRVEIGGGTEKLVQSNWIIRGEFANPSVLISRNMPSYIIYFSISFPFGIAIFPPTPTTT